MVRLMEGGCGGIPGIRRVRGRLFPLFVGGSWSLRRLTADTDGGNTGLFGQCGAVRGTTRAVVNERQTQVSTGRDHGRVALVTGGPTMGAPARWRSWCRRGCSAGRAG